MRLPLRVLIVCHTPELGGAELALLRLLAALPQSVVPELATFADGPLVRQARLAGFVTSVVPLSESLRTLNRSAAGRSPLQVCVNALRTFPHVARLAAFIRQRRPDVVCSTSLKAHLVSVPAAALAHAPLVWHVHDRISDDYLPPLLVAVLRTLARIAPRAVIANSRATADTLPGVRDLTVAYPGFSADQVGPAPADRAWLATPVVGLLGRISPTKGQLEFVRAAAQVLAHHPEARFRIMGAPLFGEQAYAETVRVEARRLGVDHALDFTGHTDDPAAALDGLTLFVHASPTPEPFGQVVVEAMIRGVPVVAMDAGGVAEIVRPDSDADPLGWLVPPGDAPALAAAIVEALDHPADARARADRAYRSALTRFPVARTASAVLDAWIRASRGDQSQGRTGRPGSR